MKEYLHNRDFLPRSFVISKNKDINNINKRDSIILTIIACAILPISISNIKSSYKEAEPVVNTTSVVVDSKDKSLFRWLNIIDKCYEGNFIKNEGNICVYGKQNFEDILEDENIVINTMEDLGENKYRLQVIQKDNY